MENYLKIIITRLKIKFWPLHIYCKKLTTSWLKFILILNCKFISIFSFLYQMHGSIPWVFFFPYPSFNWERGWQSNLRYYELHKINPVYLSSVAAQPVFSRSTKGSQSLRDAVESGRFLDGMQHLVEDIDWQHWSSKHLPSIESLAVILG